MKKLNLKNFLFLVLTLALPAGSFFAQVTFVKHDATGANDGSSWQDAFTDLSDALSTAIGGQIWMAAGTYKPGGAAPTTDSYFSVEKDFAIYGGFAGNETSLDQRNPAANETILSGDLAGNDVSADFTVNKTDNTRHVAYVHNVADGTVVFDGLSIIGGHTSDDGNMAAFARTGGGIYAENPVTINNCRFYNNFGRSGGSVYLGGQSSGSTVTNCSFTRNYSTSQAAGIYANTVSNITVKKCSFTENVTNRGAFYPLYCNDSQVDSCIFELNTNPNGYGGAMFIWNPVNFTISNCAFLNNTAANGAVFNYNGAELTGEDPGNFIIRDCILRGNTATDFGGGGTYNSGGSMTFERCVFDENNAANGAHVFQNAAGKKVWFKDCEFSKASCSGWGGAATCYGENGEFSFINCKFSENVANNLGGVMNCGFKSKTFIDNCVFTGNISNSSAGGAISLQNDSTTLVVTNSIFDGNQSASSGGAIHAGTGSVYVSIDKCEFNANTITGTAGVGGGLNANEGGDDDIGILTLSNSIFLYNFAPNQGGALNLSGVDATIYNCLFTNNVASGNGAGGAISNNASDSSHVEVKIINSTIADNAGVLAGGISNWTGVLDATSNLTLQNCIFRQDGLVNYAIEDGTPDVTSKGGNLSDDSSFESYFTHAKDINEDEPTFVDQDNFDYHLANGSLGIDGGVADGAPEFDLDGNPRVDEVDMGAYENQKISATEDLLQNEGMLKLSPNPVSGRTVKVTLENNWNGRLEARLYNVMSQLMNTMEVNKISEMMEFEFSLNGVQAGVYYIVISNGSQATMERLIRL